MSSIWKATIVPLSLLALRGEPQRPAPTPMLGGAPHVSPDGSHIVFSSDRTGVPQVYVMRADGSGTRQITSDSSGAHSAHWAPDGKRLVFVTAGVRGARIVTAAADGSNRQVISEANGDQTPSWSPDGAKIVFAAGDFPNISIHTMNADGSDRKRVSADPSFAYDPVWSPDGKTIAFVTGAPGVGPRVYLMNADGSNRRRLTTLDLAEERPSWSFDGKQLAFQGAGKTSAGGSDANIYVSEVATSGSTRRVTTHRRARLDETPSWFPDGQRLAIQSSADGTQSIYVIDLSGATKQRLTSPATYYNAEWSPDGKTIVFESTRAGKYAIYTVGADGSRLMKLTGDEYDSEQPSWSRDGRRIVYSSNRDGSGELYLMSADGSGTTRLTNTPRGGGKYGASFSRDDRWIVFQGRSNNAMVNENVYVVRADGSGFKRLTDSTLNSLGPRWTAEGTISFTQNRYGVRLWDEMTPAEMEAGKKSEQTVVVRVDGSEVSRAAGRVARTDADLSPDGRFRVTTKNEGETWGVYVIEVSSGVERVVAGGTIRVAGK